MTVVWIWGFFVVYVVVLLFVCDFIIKLNTNILQSCANYALIQSNDLL